MRLVATFACGLLGCAAGGPGAPDAGDDGGWSGGVTVVGGVVEADGGRLTFQPGSSVESVQPTLEPAAVEAPPGYRAVGPGWRAGPASTQFLKAVVLSVPLDPSLLAAGGPVWVATAPDGTSNFEVLDATRVGDSVTTFVWHFSVFLPMTVAAADGGVDAGADAGTAADAGCAPAGNPNATCASWRLSGSGTSCSLVAICSDGLRSAVCTGSVCTCREADGAEWLVVAPTAVCTDPTAQREVWTCGCGFTQVGPLVCSTPMPVAVGAPVGVPPGSQRYPPGTTCVDRADCQGSPGVCLHVSAGWVCSLACPTVGAPGCPCGFSCRNSGIPDVNYCVPQP